MSSNKQEFPPPAEKELVSRMALQDPLGQCLAAALEEFVAESNADDVSLDDDQERIPNVNDEMSQNILQAYGEAVSQTKWVDDKESPTAHEAPPSALLRGKLSHYNRFNGQWRIVVEDAEIRPRVLLDRKRKRRDITSLWEASEQQEPNAVHRLEGDLLVLAYDDP